MKAFVVEHFGKDGLRAADVLEPGVGDADLMVKVSAASINPLDMMVRNGEFKRVLKYRTPFVPGHDVAGVVTRVGSGVRDFQVGDEVYARPRDLRIGTFAEYITIDQDDVARKPASLSLHEAAAVPLVSLAAWQALVDRAFPGGCLMTTTATEWDARQGPVRDAVVDAQGRWLALLKADAEVAVRAGELPADTDPAQVAFELNGVAMSFNQAVQLFHDPGAAAAARRAVSRILAPPRA